MIDPISLHLHSSMSLFGGEGVDNPLNHIIIIIIIIIMTIIIITTMLLGAASLFRSRCAHF